eukprot:1188571-Prorocentrum_minimum.AAC.1
MKGLHTVRVGSKNADYHLPGVQPNSPVAAGGVAAPASHLLNLLRLHGLQLLHLLERRKGEALVGAHEQRGGSAARHRAHLPPPHLRHCRRRRGVPLPPVAQPPALALRARGRSAGGQQGVSRGSGVPLLPVAQPPALALRGRGRSAGGQ